jgi:hypothetical protein
MRKDCINLTELRGICPSRNQWGSQWANRILNAEVRQQLLDQVDKRETGKTIQSTK